MKNWRRAAIATIQCVTLASFAFGPGSGFFAADHQKPCADVRIYFQNVLAHAILLDRKDVLLDKAYEQKAADLLETAATNPHCLFNALSDNEALSLIKALSRFEEKSTSTQILLWDSFLEHYPRSSHVDEARWLRAKTEATPYEYEGIADAALQQIEAIQLFIKKNPKSSYLPAARLELARACRIAYETFRYGGGLSTAPSENRKAAGLKYRDRAMQLLQRLCDDSSNSTRSEACKALHDLSKGLCVYIGPGSPNPYFPDNWAAPNPK